MIPRRENTDSPGGISNVENFGFPVPTWDLHDGGIGSARRSVSHERTTRMRNFGRWPENVRMVCRFAAFWLLPWFRMVVRVARQRPLPAWIGRRCAAGCIDRAARGDGKPETFDLALIALSVAAGLFHRRGQRRFVRAVCKTVISFVPCARQ